MLELQMTCGTGQVLEQRKACAYAVPKAAKLIRSNLKDFKEVPTNLCGERFRDIVDAVLALLMPTFEQEIYDFYVGIGDQMIDKYSKEECQAIDQLFYKCTNSYIQNKVGVPNA